MNICFICSAFGITAAAGMPSGTPEFIADMGIAAALYCLIPERLYMPKLNGICSVRSKGEDIRSDRLGFAAQVLEEVGNDVETASDMLSRCTEALDEKISDIVRNTVCGKYCSQRKCTAVFCAVSDKTADDCFKAAEALAESKGSVTCGELPTGFDGCRAKASGRLRLHSRNGAQSAAEPKERIRAEIFRGRFRAAFRLLRYHNVHGGGA